MNNSPNPEKRTWRGIVEEYRQWLPVTEKTPVITLYEGDTPLIEATVLSAEIGAHVYLKVEGANPTGSFKDRGMAMAISKAIEEGSQALVCASTGNTSASLAAYSARAGLPCYVIIPAGEIALGKLAQALICGARVVQVEAKFDRALEIVRTLGELANATIMNSINPFRIEGQKTAAFEVCNVLGEAPDIHSIPVGNAGNITAYWRGYSEYFEAGVTTRRPKMLGWQASGAAPLVHGAPVADPKTIATAIQIGNPASKEGALQARDESGGHIGEVTDEEILDAYRFVAAKEGVFVEPASAASIAGLRKAASQGMVEKDSVVVCTITGHGLKDPNRAINEVKLGDPVSADVDAVLHALGL